jgi:hypothetical protein
VRTSTSARCPGATNSSTTTEIVYTFAADGTVSESSYTSSVVTDMPEACAEMSQQTAEEYCAFIESRAEDPAPGIHLSADCKVDAGVCHCETVNTYDAQSGTYTVDGSQIVFGPAVVDYCVSGDTLMLRRASNPNDGAVTTYTRVSD